MRFLALFIILFSFLFSIVISRQIVCRDPFLGGTIRDNSERKFMILGSEDSGGAGIGNILIFYPSSYYFALLTGRDIIISDKSAVGLMCTIVKCGFPFVSEMKAAFPQLINQDTLWEADRSHYKMGDFIAHMEDRKNISHIVIRTSGFMAKTEWWAYFPKAAECISRVTGCDPGDINCVEHHAFQRLIQGPFRTSNNQSSLFEKKLIGLPDHLKKAYFSIPHYQLPRFDIALHLRNQFHHFESQTNADDTAYKQEVNDWLNSEECQSIFRYISELVSNKCKEIRPLLLDPLALKNPTNIISPIYLYLAADNEDVKNGLNNALNNLNISILNIVRVKSNSIYHLKDLNVFNQKTDGAGIIDLVFDWYFLSLSNSIYAWRRSKGAKNVFLSTFVHSAQRLSGDKTRSDKGEFAGFGSHGYQIVHDRHGNLFLDKFWKYTFLEDYRLPTPKL